MSIGNKKNSGFDFAGKIAQYSNGYTNQDLANALYDMNNKSNGYILGGDSDNTGSGGVLSNLGRLGIGALGALGGSNLQSQQDYIPISTWKGNGLADISIINNAENKQKQLGQNFGRTLMLGSLFGKGNGLEDIFGSPNGSLMQYISDIYNNQRTANKNNNKW